MQIFVTLPNILWQIKILHPLCVEQPLKIHNPDMIECLLMAREKNF
jgi:hypothetical protein